MMRTGIATVLTMAPSGHGCTGTYGPPSAQTQDPLSEVLRSAADGVMHEAFMLNPDGDADMLAELETMIGEYISSRATT